MRIVVTACLGLAAAVVAGLGASGLRAGGGGPDLGRWPPLALATLTAVAAGWLLATSLARRHPRAPRSRPRRRGDPHRLGGYRLVARLGPGGTSHTYLGRGRGRRYAAVTVLDRAYADRPEIRRRFARDLTALRAVPDRYTPAVLGGDAQAPRPWVATAYLDAPSLREAVQAGGAWPRPAVWSLAAGVADALRALHEAGTVHGNLKPENILLTAEGVRLVDVGLAPGPEPVEAADPTTAAYLAPEQAQGQRVGPAGDVFALGSVLTYAATGRPPFGSAASDQIRFHVTRQPPDLSGVDGELRALVEACLAKPAGSRPSAARVAERAHALGAQALPAPARPDRRGSGGAPGVVVALASLAAAVVCALTGLF